jgi:hypothetical protein
MLRSDSDSSFGDRQGSISAAKDTSNTNNCQQECVYCHTRAHGCTRQPHMTCL